MQVTTSFPIYDERTVLKAEEAFSPLHIMIVKLVGRSLSTIDHVFITTSAGHGIAKFLSEEHMGRWDGLFLDERIPPLSSTLTTEDANASKGPIIITSTQHQQATRKGEVRKPSSRSHQNGISAGKG